jgi:hypothetical protein
MTTDNFCFYLQNRLIQTSQTPVKQEVNSTVILPPLVFHADRIISICVALFKVAEASKEGNIMLRYYHHFGQQTSPEHLGREVLLKGKAHYS